MNSHTIYCISNACTLIYEDNTLTKFTNNLPKELDLINRNRWEIGVAAFGVDFNVKDESSPTEILQIKSTVTNYNELGELPILYHTNLKKKDYKSYVYQSIKNIKYFPLRTSAIQNITTEFSDINDKQLVLRLGQPSLVQFHLRKISPRMNYTQTHIQVDSKMDKELNDELQDINNFKVHLKTPIHLNHGAKIGLTGISFPNNIGDIPPFVFKKKIKVHSMSYQKKIYLNYGKYRTVDNIIEHLNNQRGPWVENMVEFYKRMPSENKPDQVYLGIKYTFEWKTTETFQAPLIICDIPDSLIPVLGAHRLYASDSIVGGGYTMIKNEKLEEPLEEPDPITLSIGSFHTEIPIVYKDYQTGQELVDSLNENMDDQLKKAIQIRYINEKIHIRLQHIKYGNMYVKFPMEVRKLFGIDFKKPAIKLVAKEGALNFYATEPIKLDALFPGVMICYANCIGHSAVGDEMYPILKIIPITKNENSDYSTIHFENVEFYKCNTTRLDMLHFQLKRLDGDFINFTSNRRKLLLNLSIKNPILD